MSESLFEFVAEELGKRSDLENLEARGTIRLALTQVIPPADPVPEGGSLQQGNPANREKARNLTSLLRLQPWASLKMH